MADAASCEIGVSFAWWAQYVLHCWCGCVASAAFSEAVSVNSWQTHLQALQDKSEASAEIVHVEAPSLWSHANVS